jgi:hypothetical protein
MVEGQAVLLDEVEGVGGGGLLQGAAADDA